MTEDHARAFVVQALTDTCEPPAAGWIDDSELMTGLLTSLGLVTVLVDIEEAIAAAGYPRIILADRSAMSRERSPFRTVGTLTAFIVERCHEPSR